jgi:hypothetical protein
VSLLAVKVSEDFSRVAWRGKCNVGRVLRKFLFWAL